MALLYKGLGTGWGLFKDMDHTIANKISLLNQTTLEALACQDTLRIIELFTLAGLRMLEADFGFAWWQTSEGQRYHLAYKSPTTPYEPNLPRERGGNFKARKSRSPFFVEDVVSRNYEDGYDVSPYMESYAIIPIVYKDDLYGNLVVCYRETHPFTDDDRVLAASLGNSAAQSITINSLLKKEHEAMQKQAEQEASLKEAKIRTDFISNAAHELRTPLAVIKGNVDLALHVGIKSIPDAEKMLRAIDHEARHLTGLISGMALLRSSKNQPRTELTLRKIRLRDVIGRAIERCRGFAYEKHISVRMGEIADTALSGDEMYLDKLFANIIWNAIIYGKKGGHVDVTATKDRHMAKIRVTDDGIGISAKDLPYISERFYRTAAARAHDDSGTGLGLAIAKSIIDAHGGSMNVMSVEGSGSTFEISLPLA